MIRIHGSQESDERYTDTLGNVYPDVGLIFRRAADALYHDLGGNPGVLGNQAIDGSPLVRMIHFDPSKNALSIGKQINNFELEEGTRGQEGLNLYTGNVGAPMNFFTLANTTGVADMPAVMTIIGNTSGADGNVRMRHKLVVNGNGGGNFKPPTFINDRTAISIYSTEDDAASLNFGADSDSGYTGEMMMRGEGRGLVFEHNAIASGFPFRIISRGGGNTFPDSFRRDRFVVDNVTGNVSIPAGDELNSSTWNNDDNSYKTLYKLYIEGTRATNEKGNNDIGTGRALKVDYGVAHFNNNTLFGKDTFSNDFVSATSLGDSVQGTKVWFDSQGTSTDTSGFGANNVISNARVTINGSNTLNTEDLALDVIGVSRFDGKVFAASYDSISDRNVKKNIKVLGPQLDNIKKLKPSNFEFKYSNEKSIGFIAQEVEPIFPELVSTIVKKGTETKSLNYTNIIPILTKGIQEQQSLIEKLSARIDELEKKLK